MKNYNHLSHIRINGQYTYSQWVSPKDESVEEILIIIINKATRLGYLKGNEKSIKIEIASKSDSFEGTIDTYFVEIESNPGIDSFEKVDSRKIQLEPGQRIATWYPWENVVLMEKGE